MPPRGQGSTGAAFVADTALVSHDAPSAASARGAWWHPVWTPAEALHAHACERLDCFHCDTLWARVFAPLKAFRALHARGGLLCAALLLAPEHCARPADPPAPLPTAAPSVSPRIEAIPQGTYTPAACTHITFARPSRVDTVPCWPFPPPPARLPVTRSALGAPSEAHA